MVEKRNGCRALGEARKVSEEFPALTYTDISYSLLTYITDISYLLINFPNTAVLLVIFIKFFVRFFFPNSKQILVLNILLRRIFQACLIILKALSCTGAYQHEKKKKKSAQKGGSQESMSSEAAGSDVPEELLAALASDQPVFESGVKTEEKRPGKNKEFGQTQAAEEYEPGAFAGPSEEVGGSSGSKDGPGPRTGGQVSNLIVASWVGGLCQGRGGEAIT